MARYHVNSQYQGTDSNEQVLPRHVWFEKYLRRHILGYQGYRELSHEIESGQTDNCTFGPLFTNPVAENILLLKECAALHDIVAPLHHRRRILKVRDATRLLCFSRLNGL